MLYSFDAIIIGGGPGGTSAAKTLAKAGKKVALISTELGGECLNYGCIPTKIYLWAAEVFEKIQTASNIGIDIHEPKMNWSKMKEQKTKLVEKLKKALKYSLDSAGVKIIEGFGKLKDAHTVGASEASAKQLMPRLSEASVGATIIVESAQGHQELTAEYIILATGSEPISPEGITPDGIRIFNSHQILDLQEIPKTLLIIGGGVISVEFASIFSALGAEVTIAEVSDRILHSADPDVSAEIERVFTRKGIKILKNTKITLEQTGNFEKTLVAAGRKPALKNLGLENTGIKMSRKGIETNNFMQTNVQNIFAIGDAAGKSMLAYTSDREGRICAQKILGQNPESVNYDAIPYTIFSLPETASVGLTETEIQNSGLPYIAGKSLMSANSKAFITGNRDGFAKILAEKSSHKMLGVHIVGEKASELIAEPSLALSLGLTLEQFNRNLHSHPVLSEVFIEACEKALEMVK